TLLFIPMSRIVAALGLQDTLWALVVVYPSFTIPFCVWLLMGFFKSIPKDIEEAAMVDGCSRARAIVQIIMPISLAGILSAVIFAFTLTIQEFTYALTFITSSGQQTVGVGVPTNLVRGDVFFWGSLMAACLITSIPVAILFNLFLDRFILGFTVRPVRQRGAGRDGQLTRPSLSCRRNRPTRPTAGRRGCGFEGSARRYCGGSWTAPTSRKKQNSRKLSFPFSCPRHFFSASNGLRQTAARWPASPRRRPPVLAR